MNLREQRKATNVSRELRARPGIEKRDVTADEKKAGYIGALVGDIPFNSDSEPLRDRALNRGLPFVERIASDAFKRSLEQDKDQMGFAGHTDDPLAAFARIGENMTITTDDTGMHYRALVPDTQAGRDLIALVDKKIIRGTSFEFTVNADGEKWEKRDGRDVRTITDARLYTVNPVAFPAYPESELNAERSLRRGGNRRGFYAYDTQEWSDDYTATCDLRYAQAALAMELCELDDALDYLRCIATPGTGATGALKDYAEREVKESAAAVSELTAWIAANGAQVNPELLDRANKAQTEARAVTKPISTSDAAARERRRRALAISPASPLASAT